jgi:hypothetical protein
VTQGVHAGLLGHPGCEAGLLKGSAHTYNADRCRSGMRIHPGAGSGGKQPDRIAMGAPLAAKQGKGARGQRNVTILEALAATHLQLHAGAIDPADLEVDAFADTEATGVVLATPAANPGELAQATRADIRRDVSTLPLPLDAATPVASLFPGSSPNTIGSAIAVTSYCPIDTGTYRAV